jgi:acyl-CoA hydrolase
MDWPTALASASPTDMIRSELVLPRHANHYGTLFGPEGLSWLGQNAHMVAARFCHQDIVMVAVKDVQFLAPVPVGSILHLHSRVARVGGTSMTVEVHARIDAASIVEAPDVLRATFEMVAVDGGKPCRITPRTPSEPQPLPSSASGL